MKKSDEMKREITAKRQELDRLQREEQMDAATKAAEELTNMVNEYNITKALEDSDFEKFQNQSKANVADEPKDKAVLRNRAFNKLVLQSGALTEAEREAYFNISGSPGQPAQVESIPGKGGYLVPEEFIGKLQVFEEDLVKLKDHVTVVQTEYIAGKWPTLPPQKLEFVPFEEMTDLAESDVTFMQATYMVEDKGLIIPISKQLYDDADVSIVDVIGDQLGIAAVKAENKTILKPLNDLVGDSDTTTIITSYKTINTAMIKDLNGIFNSRAEIFTNQSGFAWLSNLEDGNNRPLLQPDVAVADSYRYKGKPVIMVPDDTLPNLTSGGNEYAPFFIGDMKSYLTFFERKGLELALSTEVYFKQYGLALRAVIRHGIKMMDSRAMIALKVKV